MASEIKILNGCKGFGGLFASFGHLEALSPIVPISNRTECPDRWTKTCQTGVCPRFVMGIVGGCKVSWNIGKKTM